MNRRWLADFTTPIGGGLVPTERGDLSSERARWLATRLRELAAARAAAWMALRNAS